MRRYGFVTTLPADRFQKFLKQIVTDIATEDVTSRSHNTATEVDQYIKGLERGSRQGEEEHATRRLPPTSLSTHRVCSRSQSKRPKKTAKKQTRPLV